MSPPSVPYLVALFSAPNNLTLKHPCTNGPEIVEAAQVICTFINWDPTEHYNDFWETIGDTSRIDGDEIAFIDLWDSNLIAALVVGKVENVIKATTTVAQLFTEGN